ncbi:hypothetical protein GCM10027449_18600 [Sinomonas notoginsengisoli]
MFASAPLTGCAYSYDDGQAPLGQRRAAASASAAASEQASASAAAAEIARQSRIQRELAARAPLDRLLAGPALQEWSNLMLPDVSGQSLGFSADAVWPDKDAPGMSADTGTGPATLHFACRGIGLAAVRVTGDGVELLSTTFACNRAWSRHLEVPASGHLDVQFSSAGDTASNVAYRLTRP